MPRVHLLLVFLLITWLQNIEATDFHCPDGVTCIQPNNHTVILNLTSRVRIQASNVNDEITDLTLVTNHSHLDLDYLCNFPHLESLIISGHHVSQSSSNFSWDCLNHLQLINVSGTEQASLAQMLLLPGLQHLTGLYLRHNAITQLNATLLDNCPNLKMMDVSHNQIQRIPENVFANSTRIRHLNLDENEIMEIDPDILMPLRSLESLNLAANNISNISFLAALPDTIVKLNLSNNQIQSTSSGMFQHLINVNSLDLGYNKIVRLDAAMFSCHKDKIKVLRLVNNNLSELPDHVFSGLEGLELLTISHNQLTTLHQNLFTATVSDLNCGVPNTQPTYNTFKYKVTGVSENTITKFQQVDRAWQHFHTFDASYNQISELSKAFFSHQLAMVQHIDLSHNHLLHVPRLEHLLVLHTVNLSHNRIDWLDVGVFNNPKLRVINLSHNRLTKIISMAFLYLPALSHLDLSHNQINYIYKMAFYRTCKHGQAMTVDLSENHLHNDAVLKLLNCFKHLQDTTCTVTIDLKHNALSRLLQRPAVSMHLLLQQHNDARFFKTWDHVHFSVDRNNFSCDCKLISDINVFEQIYDKFHADFVHSENLLFWQNATCYNPKRVKDLPVVDFYQRKSSHCHEQYICPKQCDCVPHSDHTFINCSYRHLKRPPALLLPGPKIVDIQGNHFDKLSSLQFQHVQSINLSLCGIQDISPTAWDLLRQIPSVDLHGNLLSSLPATDTCVNSLSLRMNPLECGCSNTALIQWLINCSDTLMDFDNIRCCDGRFFLDLYEEPCAQSAPFGTSVVLTVVSMCITFFIGVLVILGAYHYRSHFASLLIRKRKWYKVHAEEYEKYNLSIVHSQEDQDIVVFGILPILQHYGQYTCSCLQYTDWEQNPQSFRHSLQNSSAVVLVTSQHFADTMAAHEDFKHCIERLLEDGSPAVCVVTIDGSKLPNIATTHQQLRYNTDDFRTKLLANLPPGYTYGTNPRHLHQSASLHNNEKY